MIIVEFWKGQYILSQIFRKIDREGLSSLFIYKMSYQKVIVSKNPS